MGISNLKIDTMDGAGRILTGLPRVRISSEDGGGSAFMSLQEVLLGCFGAPFKSADDFPPCVYSTAPRVRLDWHARTLGGVCL